MSQSEINYITPSGFQKLKDELQELLYKERPEMVKTVTWAASLGDRSENADYIYGKRRLREIDRRIRFLQKRLEIAEVVDPKIQKGPKIKFGATITIEDEDGTQFTYQIVGKDELDPKAGKISWKSPLSKLMLGKEEGDLFIHKRPDRTEIEYEIIKLEYK